MTNDVLQWTTWPLTFVLLGMPLIVVLVFGGAGLVRQLLELKEFLQDLPKTVGLIEKLTVTLQQATKDAKEAADQAASAAQGADDAASEVADTAAAASKANPELVAAFNAHYRRARSAFEDALGHLPESKLAEFPRYLQRDMNRAVEAVLEAREFDAKKAEYLKVAVKHERATRRSGRATVDQAMVDELDELAKKAGLAKKS